MSTSSHIQPRRRSSGSRSSTEAGTESSPCKPPKPVNKSSTFHSRKSGSSSNDPILDVHSLPRRSITSPKELQDLVDESAKRVAEIIDTFDLSLSLSSDGERRSNSQDDKPVPSCFLSHAGSDGSVKQLADDKTARSRSSTKARSNGTHRTGSDSSNHHDSDSGLGSSVESSDGESGPDEPRMVTRSRISLRRPASLSAASVYARQAGSRPVSTFPMTRTDTLSLDEYATKQIKTYIVDPLLEEDALKEFHHLVREIPLRINKKSITCLRDLEKTLIFLAPSKASSVQSYLRFCETSIQCIHTTVDHLSVIDQQRPTDRPYTNNYFVDLVEQVRQYARIMAVTRQKKAEGKTLDDTDHSPFVSLKPKYFHEHPLTSSSDETLHLSGGMSQNGSPAELVRVKDGKETVINVTRHAPTADMDDKTVTDEIDLSMARKRKCDQGKEEHRACRECKKTFTRPCDLTKHEKTHSRPWKCPEFDCKYFEQGWPTEKERDRHVNDKHSNEPEMFRCIFHPCPYSSKRQSNCKQHMEKSHGWTYVRSKSKKEAGLAATTGPPMPNLMPTPSSSTAFPSLSTPITPFTNSPAELSNAISPTSSFTSNAAFYGNNNMSISSGFGSYNPTSSDVGNQGFSFDGFRTSLQTDGNYLSPQMYDDRRESLQTPSIGHTYSSANSSAPPSAFQIDDMDFTEADPMTFPLMPDFFGGFYGTEDMQNYCGTSQSLTEPTIAGQAYIPFDFMPTTQAAAPSFDQYDEELYDDPNVQSNSVTAADFTLFGEGLQGGESSAVSSATAASAGAFLSMPMSMFPALESTTGGAQFEDPDQIFGMDDQAIMDRYINPQ